MMESGKVMEKQSRRSKSNNPETNKKMDCGPKYSKVSESLRYATSGTVQCSMFCGGRQCKYEGAAKWSDNDMAIKGLYSSWITDNILAMARPSTRILKKSNIIQQFQRWGITAVINLQHPGEHANCGFGLEKGGFSYNPEDFMDNGIFFYNFIWQDYGVRSLESVLDMVKVMDFALQEGKVSVHCHAGLGRTGVLIACYLIFSLRMTPEQAIDTVRKKRPRSVQTRGQISCVQDFSQFLKPLWVVFSSCYAFGVKPFTLQKYLVRQRHMLHGYEARELKYIPKIILVVCKRILEICGLDSSKLKLTDPRIAGKMDDELDKKDVDYDVKDALDINDQNRANISASLEDLKGEYDECDISVNNEYNGLNQALSNSQPCGLLSYEKESLLLSTPLGKSDSLLCQHSQRIEKERDQEEHGKFRETQTETNCETNVALEAGLSQQTKKVDVKKCNDEPDGSLNDVNSKGTNERSSTTELAATAFCSDSETDVQVRDEMHRLQRLLNESDEGWKIVEEESNPRVLTALMFSWIKSLIAACVQVAIRLQAAALALLQIVIYSCCQNAFTPTQFVAFCCMFQEPVLSTNDVQNLVDNVKGSDDPRRALLYLSKAQIGICECLFVTIFKLDPLSKQLRGKVLLKIINILTQSENSVDAASETATNEMTKTDIVQPPETGNSSFVSSSLILEFFKFLTSLYENWLTEVK